MQQFEKRTLHFDLSSFPQDIEFTLMAGNGSNYRLQRYADHPAKLAAHRLSNRALGLIPEPQLRHITHFVEGAELSATRATTRRVVFPSLDDHPLPEIAMVFTHFPRAHLRRAHRRTLALGKPLPHPLALATYSVDPARVGNDMEIHSHAADIQPPGVTAQSIVKQHPEIGHVDGAVLAYVFSQYVSQGQAFSELVQYIQNNGPGTATQWYNKSWVLWSQNPDGSGPLVPAEVNTNLKFKGGKAPNWDTPPGASAPGMAIYNLTDEFDPPSKSGVGSGVIGASSKCVKQVLRATKNDPALNGLLWTRQSGITQKKEEDVAPSADHSSARAFARTRLADAVTGAAAGFSVKNATSSYGLYLYDDRLEWNSGTRTVSFPVKNWPSRYLGAYVQFQKQDGTPIPRKDIAARDPAHPEKPFTWQEQLPIDIQMVRDIAERSDTKNYLGLLSTGSSIFGAPVPPLTQESPLSFLWPDDASKAVVMLGGFGCASGFSDWDTDVDLAGVLGTGIVCYGIGSLMLTLDVKVINPFIDKTLAGEWAPVLYAIGAVCGIPALILGVAYKDTSFGKGLLSKLAGIAANAIFGKVMERMITAGAVKYATKLAVGAGELAAEITAEEALEEVPVAGWALRVVSIASDIADLVATTAECGLSPSTYRLEVLRTMALTLSVGPDPTHGKSGFKPVWPAVADHYVIQVRYPAANGGDGGTTYTLSGPMPAGSQDQPIVVTFPALPAGGKIAISASIYSATNWLCGRWDSGWINALPDDQGHLTAGGTILELLVPLTADTSYSQKQTLAYSSAKKHHWQGTRFAVDGSLAAAFDLGGAPDAGIQKAFEANGNTLSPAALITVVTPQNHWTLLDQATGSNFQVDRVKIADGTGGPQYELAVQDRSNVVPPLPAVYPLPAGPTGNQLGALQNIVINDAEFELGYAWLASGQNLPLDDGATPQNVPMYAMQSISTLGTPEDQIIEPSRGFSLPTFLAYDQFGLQSLFPLDSKFAVELTTGPVPADIIKEFAAFGVALPPAAQVAVVTAGKDWTIGPAGQSPLYELRLMNSLKDGAQVSQLGVFAWPIPAMDNFYLDTRDHTDDNPVYYLRGVDLDARGGSTFDYDKALAWGRIMNPGSIQGLAVHPHGYVIAVDYEHHKLYALKLPAQAMPADQSPLALPLSGEGVMQGLMKNPTALTITADGRILILEEGNNRVQAFDVKGNSVPCFAVQPSASFAIPASFAAEFDSQTVSTALIQVFQTQVKPAMAPKFHLEAEDSDAVAADLDQGAVDQVLLSEFIRRAYADPDTTAADFTVVTTKTGQAWLVTNTRNHATYDVRMLPDDYGINQIDVFSCFTFNLTTQAKGAKWTLTDTTNSMTFEVMAGAAGAPLTAKPLVSYMPLRDLQAPGVTYLDIATETKGYIYVLSVATGSTAPVFRLDIYNPDGTVLLNQAQAGVNAGKLTVDQYRSMFTLNYNVIQGPGGRTEPGVSQWIASTPTASA